jgi:hypothetical protein
MSVNLVNGRGSLGDYLSSLCVGRISDVHIYHTWNVLDKSKEAQLREYEKLVKFVDTHRHEKIIFVSTSSKKETYYTFYKHSAESYVLANSDKSLVIRLPMFISYKSVLKGLKEGKLLPKGKMELISIKDAAQEVIKLIDYSGLVRSFTVTGVEVPAEYVSLILRVDDENSL